MTKSKIDALTDNLLAQHIKQIAADFGENPKFMKGFMDVEFDPFVIQYQGEEGWQIFPCGNKYVWLDDHILYLIQEWIDKIEPEWDEYMAELDAEIAYEKSEERNALQ